MKCTLILSGTIFSSIPKETIVKHCYLHSWVVDITINYTFNKKKV